MPRKTLSGQPLPTPRTVARRPMPKRVQHDPNTVYPATRQEIMPIALASVILAFLALLVSASRGWMLLYGDAVAHLGIARRILDARYPGLAQLGGVWLPLPHLLILPFVQRMDWWQNGIAGAWPSLAAYVMGNAGCYALARKLVTPTWAFAATAFFALNPNLLYLSSTAMTEPLFLALLLWSIVVAYEAIEALGANRIGTAKTRMLLSGLLTMAMVFTRYDGWVLGAAIWLALTLAWWRSSDATKQATRTSLLVMTVLSALGPALWFTYNAIYQHDWLDFMRGPYSAKAIEEKTTPAGSAPRRGMHHPGWALIYFTRAAQVDAVAYELGFGVMFAALVGAWMAWKQRLSRVVLLLWLPLPFYVYSIAWGHVPMFIPQLYPGSYYNSRYGMELLPALTIFTVVLLAAVERWLRARSKKQADLFFFVVLVCIVVNVIAMMGTFGTMLQRIRGENAKIPKWLTATPLVFEEGVMNSITRIPFETTLAKEMRDAGPGATIMFNTNDHMGAVQDAGIPLRRLVSPLDSQSFDLASQQPARYAQLVIAIDGDPVAKAVAAHPEGLSELEVICNSGQGCARVYRSTMFGGTR
ncbi:hypothetical protein [Terriglobus roseus]|uniref:4-amino-4-deoxy-L-arabinose transferase n=1 Tax=Terriglobus roseus TaxID=392734 RepID=A0A1H4QDB4_9BACT|nr:hypothetical protein [Terriglobus roseus]SEC17646.1 4-amino-4-deoxy-L-arabinose transferase [Terriglobus roseus]